MKRKLIFALGLITTLLLASSFSLRADALDNWTSDQVTVTPSGYLGSQLLGVTYGNGRYVAVGQYVGDDPGVIETSEDGINWTIRTQYYVDSIWNLRDVTYGNGVFVAVGWDYYTGNNIYSSTNGINWTSHTTKIANFYNVTYGDGLFVAVGDGQLLNGSGTTNRNIYTSSDGITWTAQDSGSPVSDVHAISDVAYGSNLFVAVDNAGNAYTSATDADWERNTAGTYGYVSYCNGLFFSLNNTGTNLVSSNGLSWSVMVKDTTNVFSRVIYKNGLYAALSGTNVFTSMNGTNWIQHNLHTQPNVTLPDITFGDRSIMAVGFRYPPLPMVPVAYVSDPTVAVGMNSGFPPQLSIAGLKGRTYRIEYTDALQASGANNWITNTTLQLSDSPYFWTDATATNSQRFYRAVLLP